MFRLSPHRFSTFRQCPRRYKWRYLDSLHSDVHKQWPFLTLGQNVHATLRALLRPGNHDRSYTQARALLTARWRENRGGFASRAEEEEYWHRALDQLRWFCASEEAQARPAALEANYTAYLDADFRLDGRVDRIDQDADGGVHVVDYKTSKTSRNQDPLQLTLYVLLLSRSLDYSVRSASYLFLNGDGRYTQYPRAEDLKGVVKELFAAKAEIEAERRFAANPCFLCRWCDFLDLCPAGLEAVGAPSADASEEEDE
jgi:putative RecB family exonuclease